MLSPELYKAIITVVDDRVKDIRVTREDFNELRAIVTELASSQRELAQAQTRTEERVGGLEHAVEALAEAQRRTEESVKELATQTGKLSDNIGFGLEDVARVVLPGYLERHLHIYVYDLERKFFIVDGEEVEINLYGIGKKDGKEIIILGEVKSRIYEREVNKFIRDVSKVIPVIKGEVLKVMFGYLVHPSAVKIAKTKDITLVASYQR